MSFTNLSQLLCNMYVVRFEHSIGFVLVNVHHCFINVDTLARVFQGETSQGYWCKGTPDI